MTYLFTQSWIWFGSGSVVLKSEIFLISLWWHTLKCLNIFFFSGKDLLQNEQSNPLLPLTLMNENNFSSSIISLGFNLFGLPTRFLTCLAVSTLVSVFKSAGSIVLSSLLLFIVLQGGVNWTFSILFSGLFFFVSIISLGFNFFGLLTPFSTSCLTVSLVVVVSMSADSIVVSSFLLSIVLECGFNWIFSLLFSGLFFFVVFFLCGKTYSGSSSNSLAGLLSNLKLSSRKTFVLSNSWTR